MNNEDLNRFLTARKYVLALGNSDELEGFSDPRIHLGNFRYVKEDAQSISALAFIVAFKPVNRRNFYNMMDEFTEKFDTIYNEQLSSKVSREIVKFHEEGVLDKSYLEPLYTKSSFRVKNITLTQINEIFSLRNDGLTIEKIAEKFNCSATVIGKILRSDKGMNAYKHSNQNSIEDTIKELTEAISVKRNEIDELEAELSKLKHKFEKRQEIQKQLDAIDKQRDELLKSLQAL